MTVRKTLGFLFDQSHKRRDAFFAECDKLDVDTSTEAARIYRAGAPDTHLKEKRRRANHPKPIPGRYDFSSGHVRPQI